MKSLKADGEALSSSDLRREVELRDARTVGHYPVQHVTSHYTFWNM